MQLPQTGGCLCGKVRYAVSEAPQLVYTCHCTDRQRITSSTLSMGIVVADNGFRLSDRAVKYLANGRQRAGQYPLCLSGVRFLGLRHAERWLSPSPSGHARRDLLATAD